MSKAKHTDKPHNERGAGRKPGYTEPRKKVTYNVPESVIPQLNKYVQELIEPFQVKPINYTKKL